MAQAHTFSLLCCLLRLLHSQIIPSTSFSLTLTFLESKGGYFGNDALAGAFATGSRLPFPSGMGRRGCIPLTASPLIASPLMYLPHCNPSQYPPHCIPLTASLCYISHCIPPCIPLTASPHCIPLDASPTVSGQEASNISHWDESLTSLGRHIHQVSPLSNYLFLPQLRNLQGDTLILCIQTFTPWSQHQPLGFLNLFSGRILM